MIIIKISNKKETELVEFMSVIEKALKKNIQKDHEDVHLIFDCCSFSSISLPLLGQYLKCFCHICRLDFISCSFFPNGTTGEGEDRFAVIPMMQTLGHAISKSCVEYLNIEDHPGNKTTIHNLPAEATIAFAEILKTNPFLKALTYATGTRGTMALCEAIQQNSNLIYFYNPNIHTDSNHQSTQKRAQAKERYNGLQRLLAERVTRRKSNSVLVSFSISSNKDNKNTMVSKKEEQEYVDPPIKITNNLLKKIETKR